MRNENFFLSFFNVFSDKLVTKAYLVQTSQKPFFVRVTQNGSNYRVKIASLFFESCTEFCWFWQQYDMELFKTGINLRLKIFTRFLFFYISPFFYHQSPKICPNFYSYIYPFLTIFDLIFILIFPHFLPFFLTKKQLFYRSQISKF